jgi:hypothetical protein
MFARRRAVLAASLCAGLLRFVWPLRLAAAESASDARIEALRPLLPRGADARMIGFAYLHAAPEEADFQRLAALLCGHEHVSGTDELARRLRTARRADFLCGRTVTLNGWILSCTEARLLAAAALA